MLILLDDTASFIAFRLAKAAWRRAGGLKAAATRAAALAVLLAAIFAGANDAQAQGSRKDDMVFNSRGQALAGATVRVCTANATGQPCAPLALIYSDAALTQALVNPTTTDGLGNYFFYAQPGRYMIEISGPGITTKQIPNVILPNDPSAPTFTSITSTAGISAFTLTLSGNLTVNGAASVAGNLSSGTMSLGNQAAPPGTPPTGTVAVYTKSADKKLYYKDDAGLETGPIIPGGAGRVADSLQYVSAAGSDGNDGTTATNAKQTFWAAYDALPANGGTIWLLGGGAITMGNPSALTGGGIWLMGNENNGGDPHYNDVIAASTGVSRLTNTVTLTFNTSPAGFCTNQLGSVTFSGTCNIASAVRSSPAVALAPAFVAGTTSLVPAYPGAVRLNNVVTINTSAIPALGTPHKFGVGTSVTIAGVLDASFNGTFTITSVPTASSFTYAQVGANATSGSPAAGSGLPNATATGSGITTITTTATQFFYRGQWVTISGVAGGATSFNGTFQITSDVPSGQTGGTTFTYAQPGGANESATPSTGTVVGGHGYRVGDVITVSGVTDTSFNGTFTVATVPTSSSVTYAQTAANATSGGGAAIPAGWRKQKAGGVRIIGLSGTTANSGARAGPAVIVTAGSATDPTKPAIWLSGGSRAMYFENLGFFYPAIAIKIGINSLGNREDGTGGQANAHFRNVQSDVNQIAGNGPVVDIGGNVLWMEFDFCSFTANFAGATDKTSDNRAVFRIYPGTGTNPVLFFIEHNTWNGGGGLKYINSSANSYNLYMKDVIQESPGFGASQSVLWMANANTAGYVFADKLEMADNASGSMPTVRIDQAPFGGNIGAESVLILNTGCDAVEGPATCLGKNPTASGQGSVPGNNSYLKQGQVFATSIRNGALNPVPLITARPEIHGRNFSPVNARVVNQMGPVSGWVGNAQVTITQGIAAPDGTTNAARATFASGTGQLTVFGSAALTLAAGDTFVFGIWVRPAVATGFGSNTTPVFVNVLTGAFVHGTTQLIPAIPTLSDGDWKWVSGWGVLASGGAGNQYTVQITIPNGIPMDFYGGVLMYLPNGTVSADEAAALAASLASYPNTALAGDVAMMPGQRLVGSAAALTNLSVTGQITSTLATGTAPLVVASTTNVANLNASSLNGATFAAPGPIGSTTPSTGAFTTVTGSTAAGALVGTVASGTSALGTALIGAGTCATVVTTAATGTLTTDAIAWSFNAAPPAGYPSLTIQAYVTAGNVNFLVCNPSAAGATPAAATLNWRVMR